jgi:hypothetical protein
MVVIRSVLLLRDRRQLLVVNQALIPSACTWPEVPTSHAKFDRCITKAATETGYDLAGADLSLH